MAIASGTTGTADLDAAYEAFYQAEAPALVRAITLALGDVDLGREATDEGLARAYANWTRIHAYDNPAGWVYRVALNWARSRHRKTRNEDLISEPHHVDARASELDVDVDLLRALAALPLRFRSVVVLRYLWDWSTAEVAAALYISEGTVKSRLSRGLDRLQETLGADETPAIDVRDPGSLTTS